MQPRFLRRRSRGTLQLARGLARAVPKLFAVNGAGGWKMELGGLEGHPRLQRSL